MLQKLIESLSAEPVYNYLFGLETDVTRPLCVPALRFFGKRTVHRHILLISVEYDSAHIFYGRRNIHLFEITS